MKVHGPAPDYEALANDFLASKIAFPLGASSRIAPAVRGFAVWLRLHTSGARPPEPEQIIEIDEQGVVHPKGRMVQDATGRYVKATVLRDPKREGPDRPPEAERAAPDLTSWLRQAKMGTEMIVQTIEAVDNRCMAADGPVTPTRLEMTDDEMRDIYESAQLADAALAKARVAKEKGT